MSITETAPTVRLGALDLTFRADADVPGAGIFIAHGPAASDLTATLDALGMPAGESTTLATVNVVDGALAPCEVEGRALPIVPVVRSLAALPAAGDMPAWQRPSDSVLVWSLATKIALEHITAGRLVPVIEPRQHGDSAIASWRCLSDGDRRLAELAAFAPISAYAVRLGQTTIVSAEQALASFCDAVADSCARAGRRPDLASRRPRLRRRWADAWPLALGGDDPVVIRDKARTDEIATDIEEWLEPVMHRDRSLGSARLALRLEPPTERTERFDEPWLLRFGLQVSEEFIDAERVWQTVGVLEAEGRTINAPQDALIRALGDAARLFPPLDAALSDSAPSSMLLQPGASARLLQDASVLTDAGIVLHLPTELAGAEQRRLRLRVRIGGGGSGDPGEFDKSSTGIFKADRLADFKYEIALGDDVLTAEEFAALVALDQPLIQWKGEWLRVDPNEVEQLADLDGTTGAMGLGEALVAALAGGIENDKLGTVDVVVEGALAELIGRIRHSDGPGEARVEGIKGELRPYQLRGVAWLQRLAELGLGGVLADDMGLGKTLQAITLMTSRAGTRPHLVVCPTSVVGNWEREVAKFAPDLEVIAYHGPDRPTRLDAFRPGTVAITSFGLLRRDVDFLGEVDWDVVIYDEAQQVKNVASKGARAARLLPAQVRVAMTGTPVENRLSELWSIVDLTNPGLLGPLRRFTEQFAVPIERWRDPEAAERLRRLVAPFIMRRLKSDPAIAPELPAKQEVRVVTTLTREQAALYQAAVDEAFASGKLAGGGFARRGRILALLTALKQICNHPAHFLGEKGPLVGRSGKLDRTVEILGEIVSSGDRALVFTQYRVMGELLSSHIGQQLNLPEVPFLHGGLSMSQRDKMVNRFQNDEDAPPVFIVSLRAGGTGLNLTRATEVIHFDRWWNPAVEDQAADRTHRIGQTRSVTVHTLTAAGTVEDRIAELLERKRDLAETVVGSGEGWITELGELELRDLVALSTENVMDDEGDA